MNLRKLVVASALLVSVGTSTSLFAGTPGITGIHTGTYDLEIAKTDGTIKGTSIKSYNWTWDFGNNTATFQNGKVTTPLGQIKYKTHSPKTFVDNGDGTYTYTYRFQPLAPLFGGPKVNAETVFDITQTANGLVIKTVDSDGDGVLGSISTHWLLPHPIEINWFGSTN